MNNKLKLQQLKEQVVKLKESSQQWDYEILEIQQQIDSLSASCMQETVAKLTGVDPLIFAITIFALACFVGYFVVWRVTPALHTPLMSVTNAISGIIIVGAMIALGQDISSSAKIYGFFGVLLASINIFGGFVVTQRMLAMFKKR
jgi:H+-translocating NAD(P) transhydrogenase subunit alpha